MLSVETIHCMAPPAMGIDNTPAHGVTHQPIFEQGFEALSAHLQVLSNQAVSYYHGLQDKIELLKAADAPLAEIEAKVALAPQTTELGDTTLKFLQQYLPLLEGRKNWDNPYYRQELVTLQGLLWDFKAAKSEFVAQSQLQIQRTMQTYNTTVTLMSSLQSNCTDLVKAVIREIR